MPTEIAEAQSEEELLIQAAALDTDLYARTWFPQTMRQATPSFHREIDDVLERAENQYVAIEAYRDSAKTSKLRVFASKRIAYGISRTVLFISDTENHAVKSLGWLANHVERNTPWTNAFGLRRGKKWTETEIEIQHVTDGHTIRVISLGITGQIRGINVDDYRPDLVILDDVENEENTATPEYRNKISNLVYGAVIQGLVPKTENPSSKLVALGTPLDRECLIEAFKQDPRFVFRRYSCFDYAGRSRWEERYPTADLQKEKQAYIKRNKLSVWLREKECKVVSSENASFKTEWLKYWEAHEEGWSFHIGVDPAPMRSEVALKKNLETDYQAVLVLGAKGRRRRVFEYTNERDQNPETFSNDIMSMVLKYRQFGRVIVGIETHAYQQNLAWHLRDHMKRNNYYVPVRELKDRRKDTKRIKQHLSDVAANGNLEVHGTHAEFIQQFVDHPNVSHDDILTAYCIADLTTPGARVGGFDPTRHSLSHTKPLPNWRTAP